MPGKVFIIRLTIAENLTFFRHYLGTTLEENYDAIKEIYVQIEPFKDRRAGALLWWNEAEVSFEAALHKTQSFTLMNLLQS
jgi:hypothetical protein